MSDRLECIETSDERGFSRTWCRPEGSNEPFRDIKTGEVLRMRALDGQELDAWHQERERKIAEITQGEQTSSVETPYMDWPTAQALLKDLSFQAETAKLPYMDWPTAQTLLKELSDRAKAIREEYLQTCGKHLEGKYFKEQGIAYKVDRAFLGREDGWLSSTIYLDCRETNSRGEPSDRAQTLMLGPRRYSDEAIANKAYEYTIEGMLSLGSNGQESDLLVVGDGKDFLAELIRDEIEKYGSMLTVRYWIADEPLNLDELNENFIATLSGATDCKYFVRYTETSGYLWTDEYFRVGGHDLLNELKGYIGKFLRMEITFDR